MTRAHPRAPCGINSALLVRDAVATDDSASILTVPIRNPLFSLYRTPRGSPIPPANYFGSITRAPILDQIPSRSDFPLLARRPPGETPMKPTTPIRQCFTSATGAHPGFCVTARFVPHEFRTVLPRPFECASFARSCAYIVLNTLSVD